MKKLLGLLLIVLVIVFLGCASNLNLFKIPRVEAPFEYFGMSGICVADTGGNWYCDIDEDHLDIIANAGAQTIKFSTNWWCWLNNYTNNAMSLPYQSYIKELCNLSTQKGLTVSLGLHSATSWNIPWQEKEAIIEDVKPYYLSAYGESRSDPRQDYIDWGVDMLNHCNPHSMDVMSENTRPANWIDYRNFCIEIINAYREVKPSVHVIVEGKRTYDKDGYEGSNWSSRLDDFMMNPLPFSNITYDLHRYWTDGFSLPFTDEFKSGDIEDGTNILYDYFDYLIKIESHYNSSTLYPDVIIGEWGTYEEKNYEIPPNWENCSQAFYDWCRDRDIPFLQWSAGKAGSTPWGIFNEDGDDLNPSGDLWAENLIPYIPEPWVGTIQYDNTIAGQNTEWTSVLTDENALSHYRFGTNVSGTFINDSWTQISPPSPQHNFSTIKTLPKIVGQTIFSCLYANNTYAKNAIPKNVSFTTTYSAGVIPSDILFLSSYGTTISFNESTTISQLSFTNDYWYFDALGFQSQNANMTMLIFLVDNILSFSLSKPSGLSTTKIYCSQPYSVEGANWGYSNGLLTIDAIHDSDVIITITFSPPEWVGFNLYFESSKSVAFQDSNAPYVLTLNVVSGTLNGTNGDLIIQSGGIQAEGNLYFKSQDNASLVLSSDNENLRIFVNGLPYDGSFNIIPEQNIHIKWVLSWNIFVWTLPILGVVGAFCLVASPYYIVTQLRKKTSEALLNAWMYGLLMFILGLGLLICWLWS